jgi:hypothetical protein
MLYGFAFCPNRISQAADSEFKNKRNKVIRQHQPRGAGEGLTSGIKQMGTAVLAGVTGLVALSSC